MKIQILQENLLKAVNIASRSISSKAQLPILANLLLSTDNNRLKVAATNLETGVAIWAGAKVEEEGATTLPSKVFQEYISSLPVEKISLVTKENITTLSTGTYTASFNGMAANEFPALPSDGVRIFSFAAKIFSEIINQVAYAAATDEGRPILTGVYLKKEGQDLAFVATDGYRLSVKKIKASQLGKEEAKKGKEKEDFKGLVIPSRTLLEVAHLISDQGKTEELSVEMGLTKDGNQTIFYFPEAELSSRLIDGEYPDYAKIIPQEFTTTVTLDREELIRAVKMASIFARDSANIIKFKFDEGKLLISANSPQVGENSSEMEAKISGEGGEIAFNYRFLLDFLLSVGGSEIVFEMTGALNPGVFKIKDDPSLLHIIMPVRLQT